VLQPAQQQAGSGRNVAAASRRSGEAARRQARRSGRDGNPPVGPRHRAGSADRRRRRQVLADRLPVVGPAGADQGDGSRRSGATA
nr:hypothetical protein [Tanacetum cinerariifolium]